jgi:hypothetical protein
VPAQAAARRHGADTERRHRDRTRFYAAFMRRADNAYRAFTRSRHIHPVTRTTRRNFTGKPMLDLLLPALGTGLILLMAAYATLCDRI